MAEVVLERVVKRYPGEVVAVHQLDLAIGAGELMVLVGPSGCGKSTTLRMIAGLEEITEGDLQIAGRRVNEVAPRERDIAMVFQSYALYPHMSVFENLAFGLKLRKLPAPEIAGRVDRAARMLGLTELLRRKPRELSGGQRQRVAMGRAIVREPRVFLFDEPLSNLDARLRHEVRLEIAQLHRKLGATMVYVTHDQVEAMTLADRIAVMDGGRLMQCGTPLDLYHRPQNRFVAGFIGSPAMNFVAGRLEPEGGRGVFRGGLLAVPVAAGTSARDAVLGIRPEHVAIEPGEGPWQVEHLERMGVETLVHAAHEGTRLVARVPGDAPLRVGDRMRLGVDALHAHFFGPDGARLSLGAAPRGEPAP